MKIVGSMSRTTKIIVTLISSITLIVSGMHVTRPATSPNAWTVTLGPSKGVAQRLRRGFIGLPEANTISVQNTSTISVPITVTFALSNGTPISQVFDTLVPESFGIYAEPPGFIGTGRVEGLADNLDNFNLFGVNFELSDKGNTAYLGLRYEEPLLSETHLPNSVLGLAGRTYLPLVDQSDGWQTEFVLQNTSFSQATIVISLFNPDGTIFASTVGVIPSNGSLPIDVSSIADLPQGFSGSIVTTSDQQLSVSNIRISNSGLGLRTSYPEVEGAQYSNSLVAPALFKSHDLQTSRLCMQNTGSADATIEVKYTDVLTVPTVIKPFATACLNQGGEAHADGWSGGAVISSTQPLVAVVDVLASDSANKPVGRWTYSVPAATDLTQQTLALPVLFNNYRQLGSTVHLFNPGATPAVLSRRYTAYADGFVFCPAPISIPPNSYIALSQTEAAAFVDVSMGYITATQPIAAVVEMKSSKALGTTQRNFGYQAAYPRVPVIPQKPCDAVFAIFLPLARR